MKNTIYIAGPMRGKENNNQTAFYNAEERLRKRGFKVINPICVGRGIASDDVIEAMPNLLRDVMRFERTLVRYCDAIYMLEGWQDSQGAKAELVTAIGFDCMIFLETEDADAIREKEQYRERHTPNP